MRNLSFARLKYLLRSGVLALHLWLGLSVGLYFTVAGLTGSVLVFREELESSVVVPERSYVRPPSEGATLMPLSQVLTRLRGDFPTATEKDLAFINPPHHSGGAYLLKLPPLDGSKGRLSTTVDPYTGKALRQYDPRSSFLAWVDRLHVELLIEGTRKMEPGKVANGYLGLAAGALLLSGIWLWWPATLRQLKLRSTVKRGTNARRFISDLHNVLGIWPFVLLLAVTLTGSVIVFYKPVNKVVLKLAGTYKTSKAPVLSPPPGAQRLPIETLLKGAEHIAPTSHYVFLLYPTKTSDGFYIYKRSPTGILPDTRIFVDPYTGKLLGVERESTDATARKIMRSASGIHFGRWGALPVKILYAILGLVPLGLFVTGVLMYLRKRRAKAEAKARRLAAQKPNPAT